VPIIKDNICVGVIDLDSDLYSNFTTKDKNELEEVADIIKDLF
jgi:putative methionine-R-sulfoxide reductase with GAF domain